MLTLGPLVVPLDRLAVIAAVVAVFLVSRWRNGAQHRALEGALWWSLAAGLVIARVAYVLGHLSSFRQQPWQALYFWEDGYVWTAGIAAAMMVAGWFADRAGHAPKRLLGPLLVGLLVWGAASSITSLSQRDLPGSLPDHVLGSIGGDSVPLSSFQGRPVVVNFWATWCPPCRREMPVLAAAQQENPDVHFVFVNQGEAARVVQSYLATHKLAIENALLDASSGAFRDFGPRMLPTTLFFDAQGRLIERHLGALSAARLDDYLKELTSR